MNWGTSWALWLLCGLPLVAALPVYAFWQRQKARARFGEPSTLANLVVGKSGAFRAARGAIFVFGFALLLIVLARPQYGSRTRMLRKRGIDVVVALDFSKSMLARDVRPSRIDRAKAELTRFLGELTGDRVGIVAFAGETMEFPMTLDPAAASLFFRDLGPYDMPVGGTAIGRALMASKDLLERGSQENGRGSEGPNARQTSRIVILMTDGEDHEGEPLQAAQDLATAGIKVYVVGIGSRTGEPVPTYAPDGTWTGYMRDDSGQPVMTSLTAENETQLREIARITGGRYFQAAHGTVGVDQIRAEMRRMKQEEHRGRRVTVHEDRYALVLLPAFLFIVLEALLPEAWVSRRKRKARTA